MQETPVRFLGWEDPLERDRPPTPVFLGFPGGSAGKESTCNAGHLGSIPGLERSPGEEKGYPLQYSGLENSTDCIVHMVAKSGTRPINFHSLTWAKALHLPRSLVPYNWPQLCPTGWIRSFAFHPRGFPQGAHTGLKSLLYPADFLHLSLKESRMNSMSAHAKGQNHHSPCSRGPSITFFFFPATLSGAQGQRKGMKKKESESESRSVVSSSLQHNGLYCPWNSLGQNNGVSSLSLLQGIFPTQVSNPGLPHCGRILYQLSHKESPTILEWVSHPFPSRSSQPSNQTRVSCIAGGFFTNWTIREALMYAYFIIIQILSTG